ncbi:DUF58 domain-containing protein [Hydrogenophaga sp. PAMC20947]|uniref:DUF58 domain-containing protein n=1 Tax=Hydrogenophaga sp. PAMC20947 TaxID=2565558 RepID=UPI00109D8D0B|nr:DUF58 domain-containing protein [Hydrogenophaga sp. PAMC20947]QCB46000.1 DUF58 domain-containing protein [Hydrogenophaga sp. PAMC20947]
MPTLEATRPLQGWRPTAAVRRRVQQWFLNRLPPTDTLTLTQRNVYILPTRAGWMLALTLLVLLVGSINYQLNLGYLLTFLLAGCAVVGMHVCHANLRGLTLHLVPPLPVHAGQAVALEVRLSNDRKKTRHGIGIGVKTERRLIDAHLAWADVPAQGTETLHVAWPPPQRGLHALPALTAVTLFPLGTFRVWTVWRPHAKVLVYPSIEAAPPPLPAGEPQPGHAGTARAQSTGEFDGVRAYRRGDPQKTVVWKRAAQTFAAGRDDLVSRDTLSAQRQQLWLDHAQCGTHDLETRLSRLAAWVLIAERLELDYGLRLPGQEIAPGQGTSHKTRCLEAMALC